MQPGTCGDDVPPASGRSGMSDGPIQATSSAGTLSLLGGFVFSTGGDALLGISPGSQRLLAFLALRNQVTTRNQVAGALWPESTDEHAGANLRSAIARLHGPTRRAVKVTAADLGLTEGAVIDLHHFQAVVHRLIDLDAAPSEADIGATAVSALSKDLLPGWYDDWAVIAAEDWHQLRLHALEAVAARLTAADRLAEAAVAALAAVRAEPLRESARAALIRVHMAQGNQSHAIGEFERYRVLLRAELGIEPTSRLHQLLSGLDRTVIRRPGLWARQSDRLPSRFRNSPPPKLRSVDGPGRLMALKRPGFEDCSESVRPGRPRPRGRADRRVVTRWSRSGNGPRPRMPTMRESHDHA